MANDTMRLPMTPLTDPAKRIVEDALKSAGLL